MDTIVHDDVQAVLARASETLADLRSARLFLTGGTGFVGRWLLEVLLAANRHLGLECSVVVLSRNPVRFAALAPRLALDPHVTLVAGDVRDFQFPGGPITHVIHAATDVSPGSPDVGDAFDVCVDGTRRMLALASERRAARVLFVSSGAVYGRQTADSRTFLKTWPVAAISLLSTNGYAEGKRAAEYLCGRAARTTGGGPVVTVARRSAFVGPYLPLNAHLAIGNFIRDAVTTGRIQVRSDGTAVRSYLYAADLAEWLFTILVRGESGRAYNVGSEEALSIAAVARRVADASAAVSPDRDRPTVTIAHPTPVVSAGDRYVPDCARARVELGLVRRVSFDAALRRTIVWAALRNRSASNEDC